MSQIHPVSPGRQRMARRVRLLAALVIGLRPPAEAHDLLTNAIQHSVHLTVGARHIDLTLDLVFFEEWSARERRTMDADGNGRITRAELEAYRKRLAPQLSGPVTLRVAGRELPLSPLYDPEVDLLANDQTGPGHHRLRLFCFAPTPPTLRAGDELVVEDRLWPEAEVLGTGQAEGRDGCTLTTESIIKAGQAAARPDEAKRFTFRCVKPPTAKPLAPGRPVPRPLMPSPPTIHLQPAAATTTQAPP